MIRKVFCFAGIIAYTFKYNERELAPHFAGDHLEAQ